MLLTMGILEATDPRPDKIFAALTTVMTSAASVKAAITDYSLMAQGDRRKLWASHP